MLLMLEQHNLGRNESVWVVLEGEKDGLHCRVVGEEGVLYSVQEFDYDASSQAFKECKNIIAQLERHGKIGPFMEPVDPTTLSREDKEKEKEAKRAKSADKKKVCMHGCIACTSFDSCVRCCYVSYTCSWGLCY